MDDEPKVVQQRSTEWRMARCGVVTASRFSDIMTEARNKADREARKWGETAKSYMLEKLAEMVTGVPGDTFHSEPTRWGMEHEDAARERAIPLIAERFGGTVELPEGKYAFMLHANEANIGCSPDGIIGDDGLLEIKCGWSPVTHVRTVYEGTMPEKHIEQVQGSMWVTGRKFYIFCSYDPRVEKSGMDPLFICKVQRDEPYIKGILAPRVILFRDWLANEHARMTGSKEPF